MCDGRLIAVVLIKLLSVLIKEETTICIYRSVLKDHVCYMKTTLVEIDFCVK